MITSTPSLDSSLAALRRAQELQNATQDPPTAQNQPVTGNHTPTEAPTAPNHSGSPLTHVVGTTTTSNTVATPGYVVAATSINASSLSATDLLTLYSTQLQGLDAQLSNSLNDLTSEQTKTALLGKVADGLRSWRAAHPNSDHYVGESVNDHSFQMEHVGDNAYATFNLDDLASPSITDAQGQPMTWHQAMNAAGIPDGDLAPTTEGSLHLYNNKNMDQLSQTISAAQTELGSGAEQRTMKMQQLVSNRSQLTQMVTNMLQSMNDATKGILGNLRG